MRNCLLSQLRKALRTPKVHTFITVNHQIIRRISLSQPSIRPFSSKKSLHNCITSIKSDFATASVGEISDVSKENLLNNCLNYFSKNDFNNIILTLKASRERLDNKSLHVLLQRLIEVEKYQHIILIYQLHKSQISNDQTLLETLLGACYHERDYDVFEELFNVYIQSNNLTAYNFNLALKVFLRTNPGFAKQLLYQMIYSDYPIDDSTLYEFARISDRVSTFQTIKFAVELIKRNPVVPVSHAAYGQIVRSYIRDGTGHELSELIDLLKERGVDDSYEVRLAFFLSEISDIDDMSIVWTKVDEFVENEQIPKPQIQEFYEKLYSEIFKKLQFEDMERYLTQKSQNGLSVIDSPTVCKIIYQLKSESSILNYIKELSRSGTELNSYIVRVIWLRFMLNNTDFGDAITLKFKDFVKSHSRQNPWIDDVPRFFRVRKNKHSRDHKFSVATFGDSDMIILKQVEHFVNLGKPQLIMKKLNDLLRDERRPTIEVLLSMLKGLVKLKSPDSEKLYQLIHQLYGNPPVLVELSWLRKEVQDVISKRLPRVAGDNLIKDFEMRYHGRLNFKHFNEFASLSIALCSYNNAIRYLAKAKALVSNKASEKDVISIYVLFLKALALKGDPENFIAILKLIAIDKSLVLSHYSVKRMVDFKKTILSKSSIEDDAKLIFKEQFDPAITQIKLRLTEQKESTETTLNETIKVLDKWIDQTSFQKK